MKRIYTSLLVALVALLIPNTIWAADPDLENDYTLVKSVTWGDGTNIAGSGACAYTAYDTGNKKQQALTILTAPEDAAGWVAMQAWTDGSGKGWWNRADKGLYCVNAGRSACILGDDLTTGWLVVFECSQAASNVMSLTNASGEPDGTFSYATSEDGKKFLCTITAAENAHVGFCGNKNAGFINKISVYKPNKTVVSTTFSVKYVDMEGNSLKENVSYNAVAGATIALSDADKANITVGETTYVYDSDDSAETTVAEDGTTVVTVKFHAAANFAYTVNEVCGETNARVTNGTSYETANIKLGYRKYNAVNGQLYKKDATSKEYNYSFKLTKDNQVENIAYAAVEGTNNVVFCAEGEDIEGLTPITEGNTTIRSSNSASAFAAADTKITTLAAGKYKIHAIIYDCASSPNSDWVFMAGAVQVASFNCTTVNIQEFDSQEFAIGCETDLIMLKAGSVSRGLDAIYIVKTGDVTEEEAAVLIAKDSLQMDINAAKALDTTGKEGVDALNTAITTAEEALAAAAATVESLNAAKAALAEAVATFIKTTPILTLKATAGEEVTLTFGVWNSEDVFYVDFGNGELQSEKVGIDNKGPVKEDGTTGSATKFTGTVAGDGTIKVYGNNDIWYLITTNGAMPTTFDQPKLMNVVQMTITGANVESVALPAYPKMTQFNFNNSSVKSVDVTKVTTLTSLTINNTTASKYDPQLESIDLSKNTELDYLSLQGNTNTHGKLKTLDLSANTKLDKMYIQYNQLENVTLPAEAALSFINLQDNNLESLDLTGVTEFKDIYLSNNKLATIDLSKIKSGATINIDGNTLTTLTIPVSIKTLNAKNNQLASVSLVNATTQCNLEGNKLTLATIPAQPAGLNTASKTKKFTYAPQAALQVAETVTTLDLSSQVTVANGELDPADYTKHLTANTTFSFVTAGGTALVKGTDYKVTAPGKFIFTKAQTEKVHAVMLNEALPKFTAAAPFTTTEFTVEPATGDTDLMAEAKALAADADAVAVGKLIDAIAAAEESGDEIALAAAVEQFKKDNAESSIDYTAKVGTGKDKWTGAGGTVASVTTKTGTNTPLAELYSSSGAGIKMSQKIEGLENGLYRVKVFATSHNARGEDGAALNTTAEDVAYVFATSGEVTNKTWITARGVSDWFVEGELTNPYTIEDIEVSNGELTIGLALDKEKQTGWHSIQIYSLESINTAKAAWAIVKAALQKNINAATDTLTTGENGKAELEAAIEVAKAAVASNKLNVDEVVAANNVLEAAIHEFFEANLKIREDIYYVQETMTGKFLSRGAAWGTRAVVDDYGVPVELNYVPDNKYTIKGIDNNSKYGYDGDVYSDANANGIRSFIFNEVEGGYTLTNTENNLFVAVNYSGADSLGVVASSETGSTFKLLSVAEHDAIVAANKKAAEEAAITKAGYKTTDPLAYAEKIDTLTFKTGSNWTFTAGRDGSKTATNGNGTEVFQGTGNFVQNVESLEAGLYKVTVQAMYRDGGNAEVAKLYDLGYNLSHAYLDANGSRVQVKSWGADRKSDSNPNSMDEFGALAKEGKYVSEGFAAVAEDGKLNLTVAVPSYIGAGWFIASQVTYQKVVVDSTALARTELEKAIAKAEATDTIQRTQETINTLKAAIEAAKALVAKEDATAEELVAATTAIEDAIAGLKIEPIEGIDYSWESPKGNPIEWGGTIAYVNGDGNRLNYQNGGYYTICLNGKKANINEDTPSANAGKMVITLDKALAAGDTIAYTAFINKDATGKKASPYIIFENGTTAEGEVFSDEANIDAVCNGVPTLKYTIVPAEAAGSKTITLTRSQTGTNLFITKLQVIEKTELELALNVERYTGMGYGATEATVDFTEAKAFLGIEAITEDMLSVLNPDGTTINEFKTYDGWFNGEGVAETWGDNTKINVKFFEAIAGEGKYSICDMNGADEVGKTYSVKWQLAANGKKVIYTINVTFVAAPEFKPEIVKTIDVPVYMTAEAAYEGLTAQFDAAEVATALNIASIADAKAYIVNVTTGSFVENTTDGWRDANGDATQWANATNGLCAKIQDPASGTIDYLGTHDANFMENDTYTAKWGFVANEKAVVLNINITFKSAAFMTRINSMKSDSQQGTIYNMNGLKVNKAKKGLFIINGKKTVVK